MISTLGDLLFRPATIKWYVFKSTFKTLLLFFCVMVFVTLGYILKTTSFGLSSEVRLNMITTLTTNDDIKGVSITNNNLTSLENIKIELDDYILYFNYNETISGQKIVLLFKEDYVKIVYNDPILKMVYLKDYDILTYEEIGFTNMDFNTSSYLHYHRLVDFIQDINDDLIKHYIPINFIFLFIIVAGSFMFLVFILLLLTKNSTFMLRLGYRFKYISYCSFWIIILDLFGMMLGFPYFAFIGLYISYRFIIRSKNDFFIKFANGMIIENNTPRFIYKMKIDSTVIFTEKFMEFIKKAKVYVVDDKGITQPIEKIVNQDNKVDSNKEIDIKEDLKETEEIDTNKEELKETEEIDTNKEELKETEEIDNNEEIDNKEIKEDEQKE